MAKSKQELLQEALEIGLVLKPELTVKQIKAEIKNFKETIEETSLEAENNYLKGFKDSVVSSGMTTYDLISLVSELKSAAENFNFLSMKNKQPGETHRVLKKQLSAAKTKVNKLLKELSNFKV